MRTARAIIAGLAIAASAGLAPNCSAQTISTLVNFNATWKYEQSATDLGTTWRNVGFNDATWQSGPGLLQGGETTAYPVPFGTTLNPPGGKTCNYFRTTFQGPSTTNGILVYATNFVDDGCVIWLNGVEAGRIRMPAGTPTYATLASGGPTTEGQIDLLTINPALLRPNQQNTLAVEVHQPDLTSSDVVWGTRIVAYLPSALTITNQPDSVSAVAGESVTFSVGVSGGPAVYQWEKDQVRINGATNATYTISSVALSSAGTYRVIVTNSLSRLVSSNAVLSVFQDTEGPYATTAVVRDDVGATNLIDVTFNENVLTSTLTTNNIKVIRAGTVGASAVFVTVTNILPSGRTARLRVGGDNWNVRSNYYLLMNNLADARGNLMAPQSVVPVSFRERTNLTQMTAMWDYYALNVFDPDGASIYTSNRWYLPSYQPDPFYWGRAAGILFIDLNATAVVCAGDSLNNEQQLSFQYPPTLFRSTFLFPTNLSAGTTGPLSGTLQLRFMVDDGMILFLNGVEIYRYNVAPGQLTIGTRSISAIDNPSCSTNIEVAVTNLNPRTNYLAAAVVQEPNTGTSSDTYFGLELDAVLLRDGDVPFNGPRNLLKVTQSRVAGSPARVQLTWPNSGTNVYYGFRLTEANSLAIPGSNSTFLSVSNQSNGVIVPATNVARFYRLEEGPNSGRNR